MKKRFALLTVLILLFSALCVPAAAEKQNVMASFYPIYILAMNVFKDIDDIDLACMTAPETGCLHDYQLLAGDMLKLAASDTLIVCGAGMEAYLDDVIRQFPELTVIDCSRDIDLIPEEEHHHEEEHKHDADETAYNAHTWLDVKNAIRIVATIADAAEALFPDNAAQIKQNAAEYTQRLQALDDELKATLAPVMGEKIVTFHEAFPYFARAYGLEIAAVINEEHEDTLSPAQLTAVIEAVKAAGVPPLFTEPQYSDAAAFAVAAETGAKIYALDPLASGEIDPAAYENGMRENAQAILDAFGK